MELQEWLQIGLAVVGPLIAALAMIASTRLKDLAGHIKETNSDLQSFKIAVAGNYVRRDEFSVALREISHKLDKLEGLELQMAEGYAKKDDLKELGRVLGSKLDIVISAMNEKVDRRGLPHNCPIRENNG
jgi:hypothetical protein